MCCSRGVVLDVDAFIRVFVSICAPLPEEAASWQLGSAFLSPALEADGFLPACVAGVGESGKLCLVFS